MAFRTWEQFIEGKKSEAQPPSNAKNMQVNGDTPPQGKGANPYHGPHTKGQKQMLRVAEKSDKKPLGDEATPPFGNAKEVMPHGEKPSKGHHTVENFLNETHDLSDGEFVERMLSQKKSSGKLEFDPTLTCQFSGRKVVPAFYEVARYMAHMLPQNETARHAFLRELKGIPNGLSSLINEMFGYKEVYGEVVNAMATPDSHIPRRLAHAMNESYANWMNEMMGMPNNPFSGVRLGEAVDLPIDKRMDSDDEDDDMSSADDTGLSQGPPVPPDEDPGVPPPSMGGDMGMGGPGGGMGGFGGGLGGGLGGGMPPMPPSGPMGGGMPPPPPMGGPGMPPGPGGPGGAGGPGMNPGDLGFPNGDEADPQMGGEPGMDGDQMGGEMGGDAPEMGADGQPAPEQPSGMVSTPPPPSKAKKEFAYHHLAREMARHDPIKNVMREILGG